VRPWGPAPTLRHSVTCRRACWPPQTASPLLGPCWRLAACSLGQPGCCAHACMCMGACSGAAQTCAASCRRGRGARPPHRPRRTQRAPHVRGTPHLALWCHAVYGFAERVQGGVVSALAPLDAAACLPTLQRGGERPESGLSHQSVGGSPAAAVHGRKTSACAETG